MEDLTPYKRIRDCVPEIDRDQARIYAKMFVSAQRDFLRGEKVAIALLGYGSRRDFRDWKELYRSAVIDFTTIDLAQSDDDYRIVTPLESIYIDGGHLIIFDNKITDGLSIPKAVRFFLERHGTEGYKFDTLSIATMKDSLNIAHWPLTLAIPGKYKGDLLKFLSDKGVANVMDAANKKAGKDLIAPMPENRENLCYRLYVHCKHTVNI